MSRNSAFCQPVPSAPLHTPKIEQITHIFSDIHTSCVIPSFLPTFMVKVGTDWFQKSVTNLKVSKWYGMVWYGMVWYGNVW